MLYSHPLPPRQRRLRRPPAPRLRLLGALTALAAGSVTIAFALGLLIGWLV